MEGINFENNADNYFDKQWSNPEHVKVFGENQPFDVYDISPEMGKQKTEVPLIMGLGWGEIPKSVKKHLKYFVDHGRRVIVSDTPHGISVSAESPDYPKIEIEKLTALIETLRSRGIEINEDGTESGKTDIVGRSEGAIFSVILAYLYPKLVRNLVLENPAGLTGKMDKGKFAIRWFKDMKQKIMKEYIETGDKPEDLMPEVIARDLLQGVASVLAISTSDVREMLRDIKASGIGIAVIHTTDDNLFPIGNIAGRVVKDPLSITDKEIEVIPELTADYVDGFYSIRGSHDSYFYEPEKFAMVIDQALDALENKKKLELENTGNK